MTDPMVITSMREFDAKHGDYIVHEGWLLFTNGAERESSMHGVRVEPPTDPYQLSKKQLFVRELLLEMAIDNFRDLKHQLQSATYYGSRGHQAAPDDAELIKLKELQKVVEKWKAEVDTFTKLVHENRPQALRQREAAMQSHVESNTKFAAELNKIEI